MREAPVVIVPAAHFPSAAAAAATLRSTDRRSSRVRGECSRTARVRQAKVRMRGMYDRDLKSGWARRCSAGLLGASPLPTRRRRRDRTWRRPARQRSYSDRGGQGSTSLRALRPEPRVRLGYDRSSLPEPSTPLRPEGTATEHCPVSPQPLHPDNARRCQRMSHYRACDALSSLKRRMTSSQVSMTKRATPFAA